MERITECERKYSQTGKEALALVWKLTLSRQPSSSYKKTTTVRYNTKKNLEWSFKNARNCSLRPLISFRRKDQKNVTRLPWFSSRASQCLPGNIAWARLHSLADFNFNIGRSKNRWVVLLFCGRFLTNLPGTAFSYLCVLKRRIRLSNESVFFLLFAHFIVKFKRRRAFVSYNRHGLHRPELST